MLCSSLLRTLHDDHAKASSLCLHPFSASHSPEQLPLAHPAFSACVGRPRQTCPYLLYPHQLAPVPSMTVVELRFNRDQATQAAGAFVPGPLAAAIDRVLDAVRAAMR